jgi:hypothetical protein
MQVFFETKKSCVIANAFSCGAHFAILSRMKRTKKIRASRERLPDRASELLVNQRMLEAHRDEIKADIRSLDAKIETVGEKLSADIFRVIALVEDQNNLNRVVL